MPQYKKMPALKPHTCKGCWADSWETARQRVCRQLTVTENGANCGWTFVWVLDTPEGLADYVAQALEEP